MTDGRFDTRVEWQENRRALKVEFPVDIHTTFATYETAFGAVTRPNHVNTSWDAARFEVCGHRFVDVSELDYGVTMVNDCKYGHAVHGRIMRMTLLRSPKSPDDRCDLGTQEFSYGL